MITTSFGAFRSTVCAVIALAAACALVPACGDTTKDDGAAAAGDRADVHV